MIELTWGLIREPNFMQAMGKLIHSPLDFKEAYHISRIASVIETEQREADKLFQTFIKKFAEIDDKGNYKVKKECMDDWTKQTGEFLATKFTVKKTKLDLSKLESIKFTAAEVAMLEPLIETEDTNTSTPKLSIKKATPEIRKGLRN